MAEDIAIKVENVSKLFKLPHEKQGSLKSAVVNFYKHKKGFELQKALKDISFEVKKGEFFGIVGRNGSGKSTLLKLLAGIYSPNTGDITVNGSLTPFIELGVGFNQELTGRENVFLNGALLGFNRKEMIKMYDDIVGFAELDKFMDQKLKNYSSGMQVRLAFSIAIRAHSDIVVLDEVLAVGDASFQQKCFDIFRDLKKQKRTIILVTHDMSNVERFCDRVLVLEKGKILNVTTPSKAASIYARLNIEEPGETKGSPVKKSESRWGTGGVKIEKVLLSQDDTTGNKIFEVGKNLKIDIELKRSKGYENTPVVCGLAFYNKDGVNISGPNNTGQPIKANAQKLTFELKELSFAAGDYDLTVALYDEEVISPFDVLDKQVHFSVISDHIVHGLIEITDVAWQSD